MLVSGATGKSGPHEGIEKPRIMEEIREPRKSGEDLHRYENAKKSIVMMTKGLLLSASEQRTMC